MSSTIDKAKLYINSHQKLRCPTFLTWFLSSLLLGILMMIITVMTPAIISTPTKIVINALLGIYFIWTIYNKFEPSPLCINPNFK